MRVSYQCVFVVSVLLFERVTNWTAAKKKETAATGVLLNRGRFRPGESRPMRAPAAAVVSFYLSDFFLYLAGNLIGEALETAAFGAGSV